MKKQRRLPRRELLFVKGLARQSKLSFRAQNLVIPEPTIHYSSDTFTFVKSFHSELLEPKSILSDRVANLSPPPIVLEISTFGVALFFDGFIEPGASPYGETIELVDCQALQEGSPAGWVVEPRFV